MVPISSCPALSGHPRLWGPQQESRGWPAFGGHDVLKEILINFALSPINCLIRPAKLRRPRFEVREIVDDGQNSKLTLHMVLRSKASWWKQITVHSSQAQAEYVDEQASAASAAYETWISLESPR
jgi:hypothetical protein